MSDIKTQRQQALLLSTSSARVWAEEFMNNFGDRKEEIDFDLMLGWFANALETGKTNAGPDWVDEGSIDCNMYTSLELHVAGAISTMAPFANQYSPRALPIARRALEALDTWEPYE